MPEEIRKFETKKGRRIVLYMGVDRTPDQEIQFVKNGVGVDIGAGGENLGEIRCIVKQRGAKDADAATIGIAEFVCVKTNEAKGIVNIPFSGQTVNGGPKENVIVIITEEATKRVRGKFEADIVTSDRD